MKKIPTPIIHSAISVALTLTIGILTTGDADGLYILLIFLLGFPLSAILFFALSISLDHQTFLSLASLTDIKGEWAAVFGMLKLSAIAGIAFNVILISWLNLIIKNSKHKNIKIPEYSQNPEANRQISWIIKMHEHGASSTDIAATLNSNQEKYLLDDSEWTSTKVSSVLNTFKRKSSVPN